MRIVRYRGIDGPAWGVLPGDLVMTGTPEGVAPMEIGSTVSVKVEGIGALTNSVVAEPADS